MMMPKGIYGDPSSQSDGDYIAQNMQYAHKVSTVKAMQRPLSDLRSKTRRAKSNQFFINAAPW